MTTLEVITAVDTNARYRSCVAWFKRFWEMENSRAPYNIVPTVIFVGQDLPPEFMDLGRTVVHAPINSVPSAFAAQVIRILAGAWSTADYVMTSDVDMLPLSQRSTTALLEACEDRANAFVVGRDVLPPGQFPICYNIARPRTWAELWMSETVSLENAESELSSILQRWGGEYDGFHGGLGWSIDQQHLYQRLHETGVSLVTRRDEQTSHRRLDRGRHRSPRNWAMLPFAVGGAFTDYHMHLPVEAHTSFLNILYRFRKLTTHTGRSSRRSSRKGRIEGEGL